MEEKLNTLLEEARSEASNIKTVTSAPLMLLYDALFINLLIDALK